MNTYAICLLTMIVWLAVANFRALPPLRPTPTVIAAVCDRILVFLGLILALIFEIWAVGAIARDLQGRQLPEWRWICLVMVVHFLALRLLCYASRLFISYPKKSFQGELTGRWYRVDGAGQILDASITAKIADHVATGYDFQDVQVAEKIVTDTRISPILVLDRIRFLRAVKEDCGWRPIPST